MKSARDANWGCGGLLCIFLAVINFVFYVGFGAPLLRPSSSSATGVLPLLGSAILLIVGFIALVIWFVLLLARKPK